MRCVNNSILSSTTIANSYNSSLEDGYNLFRCSVQAVVTGTGAVGTLQLQGSNDPSNNNFPPQQLTTNFYNIGSSVAITTAGVYSVPSTEISSRWLRAVYTSTATGVQTIRPVADVSKSLASKYFLISDEATANKYYIWFKVSGTGTDPLVSGYTGVEQDISTNDSAATIGTALASTIAALNSTNSFTTSGTTTVTVTNKVAGPFVPASDVNTGFTFAATTPSGNIQLQFNALGY